MPRFLYILSFLLVSLIASAQDDIVGTWTTRNAPTWIFPEEITIRQRPDNTYQVKAVFSEINYCEPGVLVISDCRLEDNTLSWYGTHDLTGGNYYVANGYVWKGSRNGAPASKIRAVTNDYSRGRSAKQWDSYYKYTCHFKDGVLSLTLQSIWDFKSESQLLFQAVMKAGTVTYTNW